MPSNPHVYVDVDVCTDREEMAMLGALIGTPMLCDRCGKQTDKLAALIRFQQEQRHHFFGLCGRCFDDLRKIVRDRVTQL